MIKLIKQPIPAILSSRAVTWTTEILALYAAGEEVSRYKISRYNHVEVKDAVILETSAKCAYCEAKIVHTQFGDIEHIIPKSLDRALTFSWPNLTLACSVCNNNKTNKDPQLHNIIDPYTVDPRDHINFIGPVAVAKNLGNGLGTLTALELNRPALLSHRLDYIHMLSNGFLVLLADSVPFEAKRVIYKDLYDRYTAVCSEYSSMALDYFQIRKAQLPAAVTTS